MLSPGRRLPDLNRRRLLAAACLLVILAACYRPVSSDLRPFAMGMTFWPPWRDAAEAERLAPLGVGLTLAHSDVLQVQVPWYPGSDAVQQAAWISGIAREHNRPLVIALDWQDPSRRALAGGDDWRFSDTAVQAVFLRDAQELVRRYQPAYLVLGVEVNYYARLQPDDFAAFVALFRRVRAVLPSGTTALVTFQYELLTGRDPHWPGGPEEAPLRALTGALDLLGLSVYPHLGGVHDGELPDGYFAVARRLQESTGSQWGIFETSWPTADGDAAQAEYLRRLLVQADNNGLRLLIWTATMDTAELPSTMADAAAFAAAGDWMRHLGLFTRAGQAKRAVADWDAARARPQA